MVAFTGSDYRCQIQFGQCYWDDFEVAKENCALWEDCEVLYCTDKFAPATEGNSICWARANIESIKKESGSSSFYLDVVEGTGCSLVNLSLCFFETSKPGRKVIF